MDEISPGLAKMTDETPITDNHSPEPVFGGISPYLSRDLSCTTEVISFNYLFDQQEIQVEVHAIKALKYFSLVRNLVCTSILHHSNVVLIQIQWCSL